MAIFRRHVWISGMVQGVGYRYSCADVALRADVRGWVRNLSDGRVEAVFEGDPQAVEQVIDWCRQGPRFSRVDSVEVVAETPQGLPRPFRVAG